MKDKELWHNDRSELNEDRRDDRRDKVSPEPGPLGFLVENDDQDSETGDRAARIGSGVSNDVETFVDKDYDKERIEDDTTTRRDEELWTSDDETLTNRERERRFHHDDDEEFEEIDPNL